MHVELITTTDALNELQDEWEALEKGDPDATYYVCHRFVKAWWDAFSHKPGIQLHVVCIRNNEKLVGIAPLSIRRETRKGAPVKVLRFASQGDYMSILVDPTENADSVFKKTMGFLESNVSWDAIGLTNIPATSPFSGFLLKSDYNRPFTFHVENPYMDLTRYVDFEDFAARNLPAKVRKYRNKLFRECDVSFRVIRNNDDNIFERIASLHQLEKRFLVEKKSRGERQSLYEDPLRAQHIRNVFTTTNDAVTFVYEDPNGELLGYRTCFLHGRTLLSWNSAYHPDYSDFRIGKVIQYDILRHIFDDRIADVFDFGAGRYAWKFEWTDTFSSTYRLRVDLAPTSRAVSAESREDKKSLDVAGKAAPTLSRATKAKSREGAVRQRLLRAAKRRGRRLVGGKGKQLASRLWSLVGKSHRPVIWYVPHPDDETIFMGGSIRRNRDRRNILVVLSRGGASGALKTVNARLAEPLSRAEFMDARLREFTAATQALGVKRDDVIVHDLPDGGLDKADVHEIILEMAHRYPRASHRTMSYLDPHRDHRTAGVALRTAYDGGLIADCVFYLPVPLVDEQLGSEVSLVGDDEIEAKRAALREYELWDPDIGRYAIGSHSVSKLIKWQYEAPTERTHGPGYGE